MSSTDLSLNLSSEKMVRRLVYGLVETVDVKTRLLDVNRLQKLKALIKSDQNLCETLVEVIFDSLRRDNCDVRLGAVQICNEFFTRSHKFRTLLTDDFQDFLTFTMETDVVR